MLGSIQEKPITKMAHAKLKILRKIVKLSTAFETVLSLTENFLFLSQTYMRMFPIPTAKLLWDKQLLRENDLYH